MAEETAKKRFKVALSFPGEKRDYVKQVADGLIAVLGQGSVFYDEYHKHEIIMPRADHNLRNIYREQSELIVPFLCKEYGEKGWCGVEWDVIMSFVKEKNRQMVMPFRFDEVEPEGWLPQDVYGDIDDLQAHEIVELILKRLGTMGVITAKEVIAVPVATALQEEVKETKRKVDYLLTQNVTGSKDLAALKARENELHDKISGINADIQECEERLAAEPNDRFALKSKAKVEEEWRAANNELQQLEKQEKEFIDALRKQMEVVFSIDETTASKRLLHVKRLFEDGKADEAIALLKTDKREEEVQQFLRIKEAVENTGKNLAEEELLIALETLKNIENPNRISEAIHHFERSLECCTYYDNLYQFGNFYWEIGLIEHAFPLIENALHYHQQTSKEEDHTYGILTSYLGIIWRQKGNLEKAISYHEEALKVILKLYGEEHDQIAAVYNNLGKVWQDKGDLDQAINYFGLALEIYLKLNGEENSKTTAIYNNLGDATREKGDLDKAIYYHEKAQKINLKLFVKEDATTAIDYSNLGRVWRAAGDIDKAIKCHEKALEINLKFFGEENPNTARDYNNLGLSWAEKGDHRKAIDLTKKSYEIFLKLYGPDNPSTKTVKKNLDLYLKE